MMDIHIYVHTFDSSDVLFLLNRLYFSVCIFFHLCFMSFSEGLLLKIKTWPLKKRKKIRNEKENTHLPPPQKKMKQDKMIIKLINAYFSSYLIRLEPLHTTHTHTSSKMMMMMMTIKNDIRTYSSSPM